MPPIAEMVHIAGLPIGVDGRMRQRCSWCGACLVDTPMSFETEGVLSAAGIWEPASLVAVGGGKAWALSGEDGAVVPEQTCTQLDPEITT